MEYHLSILILLAKVSHMTKAHKNGIEKYMQGGVCACVHIHTCEKRDLRTYTLYYSRLRSLDVTVMTWKLRAAHVQ